ncbi:SPRY-domain-containing protein, partial [Rhizodiscina lignyota]
STGKGVLIGMLSAFGTALLVSIVLLVIYFFNFTQRGRILLDRLGRPGEYDDEQQFAKEEAEALEEMDDMQRTEYMRAKAFIQANPPESAQTDISLSQFLAIQEKGVSAWEFEPELEIANCFVEGRTQIEFFDSECSVQSNLPIPKQNEVYYWEAKIYEKPENTLISIGMTTKPYPLFRLPGWHKTSLAYLSSGHKRQSYPFLHPSTYGPSFVQGDVIGVGYRPRTGSVFFTRNGKKLDDVVHGLKTQNFFPTVGAVGPCQVHVNFGQLGFVFIEANVKKWGLAPMTGSLAPPPPYGSEQGSILLEGGREGVREGMGLSGYAAAAAAAVSGGFGHGRSNSQQIRLVRSGMHPTSPGPQRSPTDISLAQLSLVDSNLTESDAGEGTSGSLGLDSHIAAMAAAGDIAPPEYSSPEASPDDERRVELGSESEADSERRPLVGRVPRRGERSPPIPSYDVAVAESQRGTPVSRGRTNTR